MLRFYLHEDLKKYISAWNHFKTLRVGAANDENIHELSGVFFGTADRLRRPNTKKKFKNTGYGLIVCSRMIYLETLRGRRGPAAIPGLTLSSGYIITSIKTQSKWVRLQSLVQYYESNLINIMLLTSLILCYDYASCYIKYQLVQLML